MFGAAVEDKSSEFIFIVKEKGEELVSTGNSAKRKFNTLERKSFDDVRESIHRKDFTDLDLKVLKIVEQLKKAFFQKKEEKERSLLLLLGSQILTITIASYAIISAFSLYGLEDENQTDWQM
ncbi:hypothetical protein SLE2022_320840 [Rubroshorea leprosula]